MTMYFHCIFTYTMKSSMSIDRARFSQNSASCRMLSSFWAMLKSCGISYTYRIKLAHNQMSDTKCAKIYQ